MTFFRCNAIESLSKVLVVVEDQESLLSLLVRIIGRLLSGDIASLVYQVCDGGTSSDPARIKETESSAMLLANLMREEEHIEAIINSANNDLLKNLCTAFLEVSSRYIKRYITTVFSKIADFSVDAVHTLLEQDMLQAFLNEMYSASSEPALLGEISAAIAATIVHSNTADALLPTLVETEEGEMSALDILKFGIQASSIAGDGGDCFASLLLLIERLCFFSSNFDQELKDGIVQKLPKVLKQNIQNFDLQTIGMDVAIYLADDEETVNKLTDYGILAPLIRNLESDRSDGTTTESVASLEDQAKLVSSSLYLMASLCTVPSVAQKAKEQGCIQALLAGFSTHQNDSSVYNNFKDVVDVLGIDATEVRETVVKLNYWCTQIRERVGTKKELYKFADDIFTNSHLVVPDEPSEIASNQLSSENCAERLVELSSLLEAVAVSRELGMAMIDCNAVDTLLHTIVFISSTPIIEDDANQKRARPTTVALNKSSAEKILYRCCNVLIQLTRLAFEIKALGRDASAGAITAPKQVYKRLTYEALAYAMVTQAKLSEFASSALTLTSWLAVAHEHTIARAHVEMLVTGGVVEGVTGVLRAQQSAYSLCEDVMKALARVAGVGRGAIAVATRGASRQIIRMLPKIAETRSEKSRALLLEMLRVLDMCAQNDEAVEIIGKQGVVTAVAECIEAATGSTNSNDVSTSVEITVEISEAISSLLGRLVGSGELREVVEEIEAKQQLVTKASAKYEESRNLDIDQGVLMQIPFLLRKFGLFASTDAVEQTGTDMLRRGVEGCFGVATGAKQVCEADRWDQPSPNSPQELMLKCLSSGLLSIDKTLTRLQRMLDRCDENFFRLLEELVPFLLGLCTAPVEISYLAISCLAKCIDCSPRVAALISSNENGIYALIADLKTASEKGMESLGASTMKVLACVSRNDASRKILEERDLHGLVLTMLGDMVEEAGADAQAYALQLLCDMCQQEAVATQIISGGVLQLVRNILQRHCSDAYNPNVELLMAVCNLLSKLLTSQDEQWTEFRTTLRRVCKSAICSTGYVDDPDCMAAALSLVVASSDKERLGDDIVADNVKSLIDSRAEDLIILAMSSSSSTAEVIELGRDALINLGLSSKLQHFMDNVVQLCDTVTQWMKVGWSPDTTEIQNFVRSIVDAMKSLSATVAGSTSALKETGVRPVLDCMKRPYAVAAEIRNYNRQKLTDSSARKSSDALCADLIGLSVQISGRLVPLAQVDENSMTEEDVGMLEILTLAIDSLRQGALAIRVVESAIKTIRDSLKYSQNDKCVLRFIVEEKTLYTMSRLLRLVRRSQNIRRISGKAIGELQSYSASDLQKMEEILQKGLQTISTAIASQVDTFGTSEIEVAFDGLIAASSSQAPELDEFNTQQSPPLESFIENLKNNPAVFESLLEIMPSSLRTVALRSGGAFSNSGDQVSAHSKDKVVDEEAMSPEGIQSRIRVALALTKATGGADKCLVNNAPVASGHVARLRALFLTLKTTENLIYGSGRVWKRRKWKEEQSGQGHTGAYSSAKAKNMIGLFRSAVRRVMTQIRLTKFRGAQGVAKSDFDERLDLQLTNATMKGAEELRDNTVDMLCNVDFSVAAEATKDLLQDENTIGDIMELLFTGNSKAIRSGIQLSKKILGVDRDTSPSEETLLCFAQAGFFNLVAHSLDACKTDLSATKEMFQFLNTIITDCGLSVNKVGLDAKALLVIQGAIRNFPDDGDLQSQGDQLVTALSQLHSSQSGKAFIDKVNKVFECFHTCRGVKRFLREDGQFSYQLGDKSIQDEIPENLKKFLEVLYNADKSARILDEVAIGAVDPSIFGKFEEVIDEQSHDPGIVAMCQGILSKIADSDENQDAFARTGVISKIIEVSLEHQDDLRVSETFICCIQPLSFEPEHSRLLVGKRITENIFHYLRKYSDRKSLYTGFPISWPPPGKEEDNEKPVYVDDVDEESEEKNQLDIRFSKTLVQVLANLACANEVDYIENGTEIKTTDSVVRNEGVSLLASLMRENMNNVRLLEDVLCALSNIAFVSLSIQVIIGDTCIDAIVQAMRIFCRDEFLFRMALRAIGNITRCDENIMRIVGHGGISGLVSGMRAHFSKPEVLELAADVVGNLASVDEKKVTLDKTKAILQECHSSRISTENANQLSSADRMEDPDKLTKSVEKSRSSKEAVCLILYEDEGPKAIVSAMETYNTHESLVISCLRALHYSSGSEKIVAQMMDELDLISNIVKVMTSCDFNAELLRRGVRVLGQVLAVDSARSRVVSAGVPQVLLSAIETHHPSIFSDDEAKATAALGLCSASYAVLYEMPCKEVFDSVRELNSAKTSATVLHDNLDNVHYATIIIASLYQWCDEPDIAKQVAKLRLQEILRKAAENAEDADRIAVLQNFIALIGKLSSTEENAEAILDGNVVPILDAFIAGILETAEADPESETMLKYRCVILEVLSMFDKMSSNGRDTIVTLLRQGMWSIIRKIHEAYLHLRSNGKEFYDRETCEAAEKLMTMCREHDIPRSLENTLEGFRDVEESPMENGLDSRQDELQTVALSSKVDPNLAQVVTAQLKDDDFIADLWIDNSVCPCSVKYLVFNRTLIISPDNNDKLPVQQLEIALNSIRGITEGNPLSHKKKMFKRCAKKNRSFYIEHGAQNKAVHIECESPAERDVLVEILQALRAKASGPSGTTVKKTT